MIKIKDSYDVIVVGAGPGGSATAKSLGDKGLDVLLLEKRPSIGSEKRCAEGLSVGTLKVIEEHMGRIDKRCYSQMIDGAIAYAPNGNRRNIDFGEDAGAVMERKVFDKWLATQAARSGAQVETKVEVIDVLKENDFVVGVVAKKDGEKIKIKSKVVVAADGVESTVARKAGLNTANKVVDIDSGFQYEMANLKLEDPKKIELWLGNDIAPRGYVWIFPKGKDVANVGIGIALSNKNAKDFLDKFINNNPKIFSKASILEVNSGGIPVGGFLKNMVLNGFLVVGDAAHQVNPVHGGGMKEATLAGFMAGDVISKAIERGDVSQEFLSEYNKIWWKKRGKSLEKVEKMRHLVEKLSDDDFNMLAEKLEGEDLIDFCRGANLFKLGKLLLKKPSLAKLAKRLI